MRPDSHRARRRAARKPSPGTPGSAPVCLSGPQTPPSRQQRRAHRGDLARGSTSAADAGLNALISKLRKVLGTGMLDGRASLRLHLDKDARIDFEVAAKAVHRSESQIALRDWKRAGVHHSLRSSSRNGSSSPAKTHPGSTNNAARSPKSDCARSRRTRRQRSAPGDRAPRGRPCRPPARPARPAPRKWLPTSHASARSSRKRRRGTPRVHRPQRHPARRTRRLALRNNSSCLRPAPPLIARPETNHRTPAPTRVIHRTRAPCRCAMRRVRSAANRRREHGPTRSSASSRTCRSFTRSGARRARPGTASVSTSPIAQDLEQREGWEDVGEFVVDDLVREAREAFADPRLLATDLGAVAGSIVGSRNKLSVSSS